MATMAPRDQSLFAPDPISDRSVSPKKLLIAVDDSKATIRVLQYVGALLRETPEVTITLFHVLNPMPRELMEHGGSENPDMEHQLGEQLRKDQQEWMQAEETLEYPILERARGRLSETGFPTDRVVLKLGCHVTIDYTQPNPHDYYSLPAALKAPGPRNGGKEAFDWVAAGRKHAEPAHRTDRGESGYPTIIPGKISEQRSYTRFEDIILGVNGEGRISPLAPGCQVSATIIGPDGKPIITNHIFRTPAGTEGSGGKGQLSSDMSPTQPHTTTKNARSCESCHTSEKALGYGIGGGAFEVGDHRLDVGAAQCRRGHSTRVARERKHVKFRDFKLFLN